MDKMMNEVMVEENEVEVDGVVYVEKRTYRLHKDGHKELACSARHPKVTDKLVTPEPTQLDRIESMLKSLLEKI